MDLTDSFRKPSSFSNRTARLIVALFTSLSLLSIPHFALAQSSLTVQAEDFDDMIGIISGSNVMGYWGKNEGLTYNDMNFSGVTSIDLRLSGVKTGHVIELRKGSRTGTLLGSYTLVSTGSWGTYKTINVPINSASGTGALTIYVKNTSTRGNALNLDWFRLNSVGSTSSSGGFTGTFDLPGKIEAEKYNAATDTTTGNASSSVNKCTYYGLDVDVQDSSEDGSCNVGWTAAGETLIYNINNAGGTYNIHLRLAAKNAGKRVQVLVDGSSVGTVTAEGNGWTGWHTKTISNVSVPSNTTLTVKFLDGSTNLNYLQFSSVSTTPNGPGVGDTIQAEDFNPSKSFSYKVVNGRVEYFNGGSYVCYDNINLSGVNSIDITYARDNAFDRPSRLGIFVDNPNVGLVKGILNTATFFDVANETWLGEKNTTGTGGWTTNKTMNIGIKATSGTHTLCLVGLVGGGVGNLDKFRLKAESGSSAGRMNFDFKAPTTSPWVPKITTNGNKVLFGGTAQSIAGPSLYWSNNYGKGEYFYNAATVKAFKDNWNAKLVRAAIGVEQDNSGILSDYFGHRKRAYDVISAAIENGMYVIIDWHSHHAEDYQSEAIAFFKDMASKYGQYNNVIYEIYNEPLSNSSWNNDIKPYAETVINEIRKIDPDNLIVVGTPTWSQDVDIAANNPINKSNIAYTLHFYANTHRQSLRDKAQVALNKGIPLFVTEWGTTSADGSGSVNISETDKWMTFLKNNKISHANWSISDHESSSIFEPGTSLNGAWGDGDLSASGNKAKEIIENW